MLRRLAVIAGCAVALATAIGATAQPYPAKPVRIVVPYTAGGQTDLLARAMAQSLGRALERHVIVENKPGAAALIGTRAVQTAPADSDLDDAMNSGERGTAAVKRDHRWVARRLAALRRSLGDARQRAWAR